MSIRVFLTGATGFIGSHIAEMLLVQGFSLAALRRGTSDLWRCSEFEDQITWITEDLLESDLTSFQPQIIMHFAWEGINSRDRENWEVQFSNFQLLAKLITLSKKLPLTKFIALGSQAEYGSIEGRTDESMIPKPNNAYAITKVAAQKAIEMACQANGISWYWLRVYSVFGPKEDKKWFLPMIIDNLLHNSPCQLTPCEQQYDYLYVKDLAAMILKVLINTQDHSGIYNVCSGYNRSLKSIVLEINNIIDSKSAINFGAVPYRENQSMHIEGSNELFQRTFGTYFISDLSSCLDETINYYKSHNRGI